MKASAQRNLGAASLIAAAMLLSLSAAPAKEPGVEAGVLACDIEAVESLISGSSRDADCVASLDANALVGGGNSLTLRPVSINGAEGMAIAAGLGLLTLDAVP